MLRSTLITIFIFIFSNTLFSADYFWVGGTGSWSDLSKWSSTSPAFTAVTVLPGPTDNVIFNDNSGLTAAETVTMDVPVTINNFDFSAVSTSFIISSALPSIEIQGSLSSNGLATITWLGDLIFNSSAASQFILSNGTNWNNNIYVTGNFELLLSDDLLNNKDIYVDNGGLNLSGNNLECLNFYSLTTNTRSISIAGSVLTLNGLNWDIDPNSLTFSSGSSSILLNNTGNVVFNGADQIYDTVRSSASLLEVYGNNTFTFADLLVSSQLDLENSSVQQIDSLLIGGACGSEMIISAINPGQPAASIEKIGHPYLNASNISLTKVNAIVSSGQVYSLALSDTTNSSNWTFSGGAFHWIGGTGNWNDSFNWDLGCVPGPEDSVYFDAGSFASIGDTVFVNADSYFGYMDWSLATNSPSLKLNAILHAYGDIVLNQNMLVTSLINGIEVNRQSTLTSNDNIVDCIFVIDMIDESHLFSQADNLVMTDFNGLILTRGELHTNSNSLTTGYLRVRDRATPDLKNISLYNSEIILKQGFNAEGVVDDFNLICGNSHLYIGDSTYQNYLKSDLPSIDFWDVTLDFHKASVSQVVEGFNLNYNKLKILPGSNIEIESASIHTVSDSLIFKGNCLDSITIYSSVSANQAIFNKSTTNDAILECLNLSDIEAGDVALTADYSTDLGNNTNWTINNLPPVTASFTADGPFCFGDSTFFTDLSAPIPGSTDSYSQRWQFDTGLSWYEDFTADSTATLYTLSGDMTVSLVTEYSNFCTDTASIDIFITDPGVFLTSNDPNQIICQNQEVIFEAGSSNIGVDYEFFLNGLSLNVPSPNDTLYITNSLIDQDTISVVTHLNGCTTLNPPSMVFSVLDAPVFDWVSSDLDTTICFGDSVGFSASTFESNINFRYLLNGSVETLYSPATDYYNLELNDLDIVSVVAQNSSFCTDTLSMEFTVHPLPILVFDDDVVGNVICENQAVEFTCTGADSYQFFINDESQGVQSTGIWTTTEIATGDVISVIGYSAEGCEKLAANTFTYTVNPLPIINYTTNPGTTICSGTNVTFNLTGGATYQMFINGAPQGIPSPTSSYTLNTINNNDQIHFTGGFSGCTNTSDTTVFTVNTSPTTTLVSDDDDQIICRQDLVIFTATGADTYDFLINGVSQGGPSTSGTFSTNALTNGQTVSVIGQSNTCEVTQSQTFTVLTLPSVNLFSNDADNIICEGQAITFTGVNAVEFDFHVNNLSQGGPSTTNTFTPILNPGINNVFVIGTGANGCADTSSTTIDVLVNPTPTVLLNSSDDNDIICEGESVTFTASGSNQYQFFLDGVPQGSLSTNDSYVNDNLTNNQTIHVIGSSFGCTNNSNDITISVVGIPNVELDGTDIDNIFCENVSVDYEATGAATYEFFLDDLTQGAPGSNSVFTTAGLNPGTYSLMVVGDISDCRDSAEVTFTLNAVPTAGIVSNDDDNSICSGDNVTYTGSGGALYQFFINGNSQGAYSPINNMSFNDLIDGDEVSVLITDATGCTDADTMDLITVYQTPAVTLSSSDGDQEICVGDDVFFMASGATNYEFYINGDSQGASSPADLFFSNTLNDGDEVYVIGESNLCNNSSSIYTFTVYGYPTVSLVNNGDETLCASELTDLEASGATSYQWYINGNPFGGITTSSSFNNSLINGDIITVNGILNGCEASAPESFEYSVTNYPTLTSSISPGTTICIGDEVVANVSGGLTYVYELNGIDQNTIGTYSSSTIQDGDVLVITAYDSDCPSTPASYTFNVNSMDLEMQVTASTLICEGENVTFTASGGNQYLFYVNGAPQGSMSPTNTFSSSSLSDGDIISFDAWSSSTGCIQENDDYAVMQIIAEPLISNGSSTIFCEGDSVVLYSNASYGNQWLLDGVAIDGAIDTSYTAYTSGTYSLEVNGGGNGHVWSFGENASGVFADGTNLSSADPTSSTSGIQFDEIASGESFIIGVDLSGFVYSWGDNSFGQLGDGTFASSLSSIQVPTLSNVKTVATSQNSSMAVLNTGEVYVWGRNHLGQLGTGHNSVINFPYLNASLSNVDTIAGGKNHYVILLNDGTVWTTGANSFGQLGIGNFINQNSPQQVASINNIVSIGAGEYHSFAIAADGSLYVWGNNGSGQLGLGDIISHNIPTLSNLSNVSDAVGGATHSLFLTSSGKVYSCGDNSYGQLGNGTTTSSTSPLMLTIGGIEQISASEYTTIIRRTDNSVYVAGNNNVNQLSSSTGSIVSALELVEDVDGVKFIEANPSSSHFIYGEFTSCNSASISVTELPSPSVNIIIGDTILTASETGVSYQWYLNGLEIPGATEQSYEPIVTGTYSVQVTYENGCSSTSPTTHQAAGIVDLIESTIKIYPNPTNDILTIDIDNFDLENVSIIDAFGRQIEASSIQQNKLIQFDVLHLAPGMYRILMTIDNLIVSKTFIKSN